MTPRNRACLALTDIRDVSIICDGVEMICTETTRALSISNCEDLTVRGLSIDYDPLPFTQGRIVALSADKSVHDIELTDGYPTSDTATPSSMRSSLPTRAPTAAGSTTSRRWRSPTRSTCASPVAAAMPMTRSKLGDIIAIGAEVAPHGSIPHAVEVAGSKCVRLEDISVYASNCFGFLEYNCDGTTYYRCKVDRRPPANDPVERADPRIRSLNADAFHSIAP